VGTGITNMCVAPAAAACPALRDHLLTARPPDRPPRAAVT
jgi:hypothetical protein